MAWGLVQAKQAVPPDAGLDMQVGAPLDAQGQSSAAQWL